jgi:hypothetical protein
VPPKGFRAGYISETAKLPCSVEGALVVWRNRPMEGKRILVSYLFTPKQEQFNNFQVVT